MRNERGKVKTATAEIQRIIKIHFEQLYVNKINNLEEKFPRNIQSPETESRRNRKYKQIDYN